MKNTASSHDNVQPSVTGISHLNPVQSGSQAQPQASHVVKSLFNQPLMSAVPAHSSGPNTPPQPVSSQVDKSPLGNSVGANSSANNTPENVTPNCTIIASERLTVSPYKQSAVYTVERNCCISSPSPVKANMKRHQVKGRLDFDSSDVPTNSNKPIAVTDNSTSESEKDADLFDMDFPNFDALGPNFSFSELLVDFDLDCEGLVSCEPPFGMSTDNVSGYLFLSLHYR